MKLSDFEESVDPVILERGLLYFHEGRVEEPIEIYRNDFEVRVFGSIPYKVRLQLKGKQIKQYSCTCPYDYGPICKHIVSVIYRMCEMEFKSFQVPSKRRPVSEQIDELLSKVSQNDLIDFSKKFAINDRKYRNKLLDAFEHLNQNE